MSNEEDTNFYCVGNKIFGDKYRAIFLEKGFNISDFTFSDPHLIYYTRPYSININCIAINDPSWAFIDLKNIIKSTFTLIECKESIKKFTINKYDSVLMRNNNEIWYPTVFMGLGNSDENKFKGVSFTSNNMIPINKDTLRFMNTDCEIDFIPELVINL